MDDLRAPRSADRRACESRRAAITPSEPRKSYIVNRWARETVRSESPGTWREVTVGVGSRARDLEPVVGIEPTTYGLRNRCSTTELHWLKLLVCSMLQT